MLWLTLRQLSIGTVAMRKKAAKDLWRNPKADALTPLVTAALTDQDPEVRQISVSALGRLQDPARYESLLKALKDKDPEVIRSAMLALRRGPEEQVTRGVTP